METSKLYRNRNMAMEELRNILKLNLRVSKALFMSTDTDQVSGLKRDSMTTGQILQMGQVDLEEFANSMTAVNLTVLMDSYPNVVQFIKLCQTPIFKLFVMCQDDFEDFTDLEQVTTAMNLKITGRSNITDEGLMSLEATSFEFNSDKITSAGLNAFVKVAELLPIFSKHVIVFRPSWLAESPITS